MHPSYKIPTSFCPTAIFYFTSLPPLFVLPPLTNANARVSATFTINFEARPPSPVQVDTKTVDLPAVPDSVNGTCILETEKAKIFIFWSGYNFTLEFIKNPEGNSYYMNRALLQYNTKHPDLAK